MSEAKTKRNGAVLAAAIDAAREGFKVRFNEFHQRIETAAGNPWEDIGDIRAADWLQRRGVPASSRIAGEAIALIAREQLYHPVRDYLNEVTADWNGVPRIDTWLVDYLGAEDTPYMRAIGARFLISGAARVFEPGCKADCVPILEGPQGIGKSTAARTLAAPWFTDEIGELGSKDAAMQVAGAWMMELSELDAMTRGEVARIKAFISRSTDRFRPPYGRNVIALGRQCVFIGTTNSTEYLRDETGARRFWPVKCGRIDVGGLSAVRNDLWAEAVTRYRKGERWWLDTKQLSDEAAEQQRQRFVEDPWLESIRGYLTSFGIEDISVDELMTEKIGRPLGERSQADQNRVARILQHLGWERYQRRAVGRREWRYRPVTTVTSSEE